MKFKEYYFLTENIETKLPHLVRQFGGIAFFKNFRGAANNPAFVGDIIRTLAKQADPTPSAEYITWILRLLKNGNIRGLEDAPKIFERLAQFTLLKRTGRFTGERDINHYKTFAQLAQTLDEFEGIQSKGAEERTKEEKGVKLIKDNGQFKLWVVTTPEAAAKLFRRTEWCVKDPKFFNQYKTDKNFYYIEKDGKPAYLAHFGSNQLKDVYDDTLEPGDYDVTWNDDKSADQADAKYSAIKKDIPHIHALIKTLPGYAVLLADAKTSSGSYEADSLSAISDYVHQWISFIVDEPAEHFTSNEARAILADPKNAAEILKKYATEDNKIYDAARNDAHDGVIEGSFGTEFAPILRMDGIKVPMYGIDWKDEPNDFAENVNDYLDSFEDYDNYVDILIKHIKEKSLDQFADEEELESEPEEDLENE